MIPVPIPGGPLPISEEDNTRAEAFVEALARVMLAGTSGASIQTPPTLVSDGMGGVQPVQLDTPEKQLFYRQVGLAITKAMEATLPGEEEPTIINHLFTGACLTTDAIGDVVRVSGPARSVTRATLALLEASPAIGVIISKPTSTSAVVQVGGLVEGVYTGLTPGKLYFVGNNGRPSSSLPTGASGDEIMLQSIGIAIDSTTLLVQPGTTISSFYAP